MPINVKCHQCGKTYRLKDEMAGRKFKCKDCEAVVVATAIPDAPPNTGRTTSAGSQAPPNRTQPRPAGSGTRSGGTRSRSSTPERSQLAASTGAQAGPARRPTAPKQPVKKKKPEVEPYAEPWPEDDYDDELYGDAADDTFGAPPPKRKSKSSASSKKSKSKASSGSGFSLSGITFNLNRLNAVLVFFGGMLCVMGCREMGLANKAGAVPKPIALQQLLTDGPGNDVYFSVTDLRPVNDAYVADESRSGRMSAVWFVCEPTTGATGDQSFVVYSTDTPTEGDVAGRMMTNSHTGMLINSIKGLDRETKKLLRENMPGVNVDTAYIFHVGRTPAGFIKYAGMMLGGLVLAVAGLAWIFLVRA